MGLLSRIFGRKRREPAATEHLPEASILVHRAPKVVIAREDLPIPTGGTQASVEPPAAEAPEAASAVEHEPEQEEALRTALAQVEELVEQVRNDAGVATAPVMEDPLPSRQEPEVNAVREVQAPVTQSLVTEASATMLVEYLKHFFELISVENRMIDRRLESLEQTLDRVERRISSDSAELEERVTTLEGVQLPLVRPSEPAVGLEARDQRAAPEPQSPAPDSYLSPEAAGDEQSAGREESAEGVSTMPSPSFPRAAIPDRSSAVEGRITISGLATFRMLATVRDTLKRSAPVLAAEPTHFEAGNAELRIRAIRPLSAEELTRWLEDATGERVEATGDLSFKLVAREQSEA